MILASGPILNTSHVLVSLRLFHFLLATTEGFEAPPRAVVDSDRFHLIITVELLSLSASKGDDCIINVRN